MISSIFIFPRIKFRIVFILKKTKKQGVFKQAKNIYFLLNIQIKRKTK
jgi:hypothetical protein